MNIEIKRYSLTIFEDECHNEISRQEYQELLEVTGKREREIRLSMETMQSHSMWTYNLQDEF